MSGETILGIIAGIAIAAVVVWIVIRQGSKFKSIVAEFMEAGKAKNVEAAYACCSLHSLTKEEIADLIRGSYVVFAGYERLTVRTSQSGSGGGITGIRSEAYASGAVIYDGGKRLPLKASFVKEEGVWKIRGVRIGSTERGVVRRPSMEVGPGPVC